MIINMGKVDIDGAVEAVAAAFISWRKKRESSP
jgi:hypothetical protein